jgi:hypothetical protein
VAFILAAFLAAADPGAIVLNLTDATNVIAAGSANANANAIALPKSQDFINPPP